MTRMSALGAIVLSSHPLPTIAVTALAGLLTAAFQVPFPEAVLVIIAVFFNQFSVGVSNDAIDVERDREAGRRDKPLIQGGVSIRLARAVAVICGLLSIALSLVVHPLTAVWQTVFLLAGWAYNAGLKATVFSALAYAVGFGSLPPLVSYAASPPEAPQWWVVGVACLLGVSAHFANVVPDRLADQTAGVRGLPHRLPAPALAGSLVVLTAAAGILLVLGAGAVSAAWTISAAAVALLLSLAAASISIQPTASRWPFRLSMLAALSMAVGLAQGLSGSVN